MKFHIVYQFERQISHVTVEGESLRDAIKNDLFAHRVADPLMERPFIFHNFHGRDFNDKGIINFTLRWIKAGISPDWSNTCYVQNVLVIQD